MSKLLAKESVIWQVTRAREKSDALMRLIQEGRATPSLLCARASEIQGLSDLPASLLNLAIGLVPPENQRSRRDLAALLAAAQESPSAVPELAAAWRFSLEAGYPNLLSAEDVERRERIGSQTAPPYSGRNTNPVCVTARSPFQSNIAKRGASPFKPGRSSMN